MVESSLETQEDEDVVAAAAGEDPDVDVDTAAEQNEETRRNGKRMKTVYTGKHRREATGKRKRKQPRTSFKSYKTKGRFKDHDLHASNDGEASNEEEAEVTTTVYQEATTDKEVEPDDAVVDGYELDEIGSLHSESDEEQQASGKYPTFNPSENPEENQQVVITLGMEFQNLETFKNAIRDMNIHQGREVDFVKNDAVRVRAMCVERGESEEACQWQIFCSENMKTHTFQVKTLNPEHTCCRRPTNKLATREWISIKLVHTVRTQHHITGQQAYQLMKSKYKVMLNDAMVYRALQLARKLCEGEEKKQYERLRDYVDELLKQNTGSTIALNVRPISHEFQRLYICLEACKKGFMVGCRPLIGLDGCFLKGYYGGQLLTAVGQDGNNSFYVIAYAIVEVENTLNWTWFITQLMEDLQDPDGRKYAFISDMQKGLDAALNAVCPTSPHRFCCRHIWANLVKHFKAKADMKKAFRGCYESTTVQEFEQSMEVVKRIDPDAHEWLTKIPAQHWSRSAFDTWTKNDAVTSNMCEQFNRQILSVREKPIISLVEGVRMYITRKNVKCEQKLAKHKGVLCQRVQKKLEKLKEAAMYWTPHWSGDPGMAKFEVTCPPHSKCAVDLQSKTCSCRSWDVSGVPCIHVIACITYNHQKPEAYVNVWLTKEENQKIYSHYINPVAGEASWTKSSYDKVEPPYYKRGPGRPKKQRKKAHEEKRDSKDPHKLKRTMAGPKCSKCGEIGHNVRTCKGHMRTRSTGAEAVTEEALGSAAADGQPVSQGPEVMNTEGSSQPQPTQPSQSLPAEFEMFKPPRRASFRPPRGRGAFRPSSVTNVTGESAQAASSGTLRRFTAYLNPTAREAGQK